MKQLFFILSLFVFNISFGQFKNNNPSVYNIKNYGAKGDGRQVFDGVTNGTTTFTSATAAFTQADVGKIIRIPRGTSSTAAFVGTIASVSNSTTVLLNSAASATTTADTVVFGSDNTTALRATLDACNTGGGGVVFGPAGWYLFGGPLITSYYGTNPNSQIPWPVTSFDSTTGTQNQFFRRRFIFRGEATGLISLPVNGGAGAHPPGATIYETIIDGSTSGSVPATFFGTKSPDVGGLNLNANEVSFEDLIIEVPTNSENRGPSIGGINAYYSAGTTIRNCAVVIDGLGQSSSLPTNDVAGIVLNRRGGELANDCENVSIAGFPYGLITSDHALVKAVSIYWCNFGRVFAGCFDLQTDAKVNIQWCKHLVYVPKTSFLGGMLQVYVDPSLYSYFIINSLDAEIYTTGSQWYTTTDCVSDSNVYGRGIIYYALSQSGTGFFPATQNLWNKQNADSIYCYNIGKPFPNPNVFSTGLTNTLNTITNNLLTGLSGGQTIIGGTGSGENLVLSTTSNGAKGKLFFGASANNNYFNESFGNLVLGTGAATNYIVAGFRADLTGGAALFPGTLMSNTSSSSPGGGQYNIAPFTSTAGNGGVSVQFSANFGSGATAPFTTQGGIIGTRTNDPLILFQNSNQIARVDAGGLNPFTTTAFDLGSTSLKWRNEFLSGDANLTGAQFRNVTLVSATGTYNVTATDFNVIFTGSTATVVYPTATTGRSLWIVNQASGTVTIPTTTNANGSTSTSVTTGQWMYVFYDGTVWRGKIF